jgi:hypothetical protein
MLECCLWQPYFIICHSEPIRLTQVEDSVRVDFARAKEINVTLRLLAQGDFARAKSKTPRPGRGVGLLAYAFFFPVAYSGAE